MLKDEDRIFTNLYGMHDRTLEGAKKSRIKIFWWVDSKDFLAL